MATSTIPCEHSTQRELIHCDFHAADFTFDFMKSLTIICCLCPLSNKNKTIAWIA